MARVTELVFKGTNRSAIRALEGISEQSQKTTRTLKRDADEQTVAFAKTRESTTALHDSMSGLLGLVGIGGVAFGLRDLKDSGVELQAQQAELRRALVATGQAAGDNAGKLEKYAEDLSVHGGFGTTANLQTLNAFIRVTRNVGEAQKLTALATDIARGRNMGLAQSQQIVTQAYSGSVGRLQRILGPLVAARDAQVGLTTAHQQEIATLQNQAQMMGRMGPIWLRQQEINDHITAQQAELAQMTDKHATAQQVLAIAMKEFGGSTATFSTTTQGKISNLNNSLHNLVEELGLALLPTINTVVTVLAGFADLLAHHKKAVVAVTLAVAGLATAWGGLKILQGIKVMVLDLGRAFGIAGAEAEAGAVEAEIGWRTFMMSTIAGLVIVGLVELIDHWKDVKKVAVEVWHAIVAAAKWAWREVKGIWHDLMVVPNAVGHFFGHIFNGGGVVPRHMASGGPIGTDTVPAWLTPGEGVLSRQGMAAIGGENGLSAINAGMPGGFGGNITITPQASMVALRDGGREFANLVVRYTLNRAARGPGAYVGGSLVTGAAGLPV